MVIWCCIIYSSYDESYGIFGGGFPSSPQGMLYSGWEEGASHRISLKKYNTMAARCFVSWLAGAPPSVSKQYLGGISIYLYHHLRLGWSSMWYPYARGRKLGY